MTTNTKEKRKRVLLTGATGYVGGRLLDRLLLADIPVRCISRRPAHLQQRIGDTAEIVEGDILDPSSLARAMKGADIAYYLVHSMAASGDFEEMDRTAAHNFGREAAKAGLKRIVYLGGLGKGEGLSSHLASRQEVGRILGEYGVPTLEFRASIILGSGSLSFEMVRSLVERLPVMTTPSWVRVKAQPIAIEDVLGYLVEALDVSLPANRIVEIGGADVVSYGEIMQEYARQRGLKRWMIPVPMLTPHISSLWLAFVTPLYARIGRKLIEGVRNATVVTNNDARELFSVTPMSTREAIQRALANEDLEFVHTHWSDAVIERSLEPHWGGVRFGPRIIEPMSVILPSSQEAVFKVIQTVGGDRGWFACNWLWRARGWLDRLVGGVGLRRGRRDPIDLRPGDAVDFWRVESFEPPDLLLMHAEMKLPGRGWLRFETSPTDEGTLLTMTTIFDPIGVLGRLYWWVLYPFHHWVFTAMFRAIRRELRSMAGSKERVAGRRGEGEA